MGETPKNREERRKAGKSKKKLVASYKIPEPKETAKRPKGAVWLEEGRGRI